MISPESVWAWLGWVGWGILGTVARLLLARGTDGHRRAGRAVRTVMVPWLAARPLSGHATPLRRQQASPQAEVDRSTPRHPGQSYRGSDPGPGRHRRSSQSYRDVEELLAERSITVDHPT